MKNSRFPIYSAHFSHLFKALSICLVILTVTASSQEYEKPYKELVKAVDERGKAASEITRLDKEISQVGKWALGQDPWTINRARAKQDAEDKARLIKERAAVAKKLSQADTAHETAVANYRKALKPYRDMQQKALERYKAIQTNPAIDPKRKEQALRAMRMGMERMGFNNLTKRLEMADILMQGVRSARPLEEIKELLTSAVENEGDKVMADALIDVVNDAIKKKLPAAEAYEAIDKKLGYVTKALKAYKVMKGDSSDPLTDENIGRLVNLLDLTADFIPSEYLPVAHYMKIQKYMVERIQDNVKKLKLAIADKNIDALFAATLAAPHENGGWAGVNPSAPFGVITESPDLGGVYSGLLHKLYIPQDLGGYGYFNDWSANGSSKWSGSSYEGFTNLKNGYWVYSYPYWYVWQNAKPAVK